MGITAITALALLISGAVIAGSFLWSYRNRERFKKNCPTCGTELQYNPFESRLYCPNCDFDREDSSSKE
ncbi:MAG: hypothetical protein KDD64_00810 [Bdellovibrionales bacterium]|nr:hypothetical protein [Bdellovibrionales bacterium]